MSAVALVMVRSLVRGISACHGHSKNKTKQNKNPGDWDGNAVKLGYDDCHTTINVIKFIELKTKRKKKSPGEPRGRRLSILSSQVRNQGPEKLMAT